MHCDMGDPDRGFGKSLSDRLPIIADFRTESQESSREAMSQLR